MHVIDFDIVGGYKNFSCYFTKKWSQYRRSVSNFKNFSEYSQATFAVETVLTIVIRGKLSNSNCLLKRDSARDGFFQNFGKLSF